MYRRQFLAAAGAAALSALPGAVESIRSEPASRSSSPPQARSARITGVRVIRVRRKGAADGSSRYVEIATDAGVTGIGGDLYLDQPRRLEELNGRLRELLIGRDPRPREIDSDFLWKRLYPGKSLSAYARGRDPLTGEAIWNTRRSGRHTATGSIVMALSAVDNALWDLRGKLANVPVYRLLSGRRERLPAYMSLMPSETIDESRRRARAIFDQGFTVQKWFLVNGPPDGEDGFRRNVGLVEALRTELGSSARLMVDFAVAQRGRCDWDVPYAVRLAKAIRPFDPFWLEEPFSPEEIEAYARLKGETDIPLATGEHTYGRWNIRPFLDRKLVSFVQSDPEWCGGISELLRVCTLAGKYDGVRVIPHGHQILAAAHVVAAQPEKLCPMVEYGIGWIPDRLKTYRRPVLPEAGVLTMPTEAGLGPELNWEEYERSS